VLVAVAVAADLRHYSRYERDNRAVDPVVSGHAAARHSAGARFREALPNSGLGGDHCGNHAHRCGHSEIRLGALELRR